jgi:ABC-type Na+ efflux pump permease subunit
VSAASAPPGRAARIQLAAVFRKEVRQTVRDRRMMFMLVVAPLLQTVIFGFAVDFTVDRVPTVVVDLDRSASSRGQARRLLADGTLVLAGPTLGPVNTGIAVFDAPDERTARAIMDADPAVASGTVRGELRGMRVSLLRGRD